MNIPAMAIAYQPKTIGIMKQLGQNNHAVTITELSLPLLKQKFHVLLENRKEIRESLSKIIPKIRDEARKSSGLILQDFQALH